VWIKAPVVALISDGRGRFSASYSRPPTTGATATTTQRPPRGQAGEP